MKLTWIGQSGYIVESGGYRLVIDPYLSDVLAPSGFPRMFPPPFAPTELVADVIVCTHDHGDHFDPATALPAMDASFQTRLAGPSSVIAHARSLRVPENRLIEISQDRPTEFGPFTLSAAPAMHTDPQAVGLVVSDGTAVVWFSGDTEYFEDLPVAALKAAGGQIDAVVICINGRLGNMNLTDAVRTALAVKPAFAIPAHYGMFAVNTVDPAPFVEAICASGTTSFAPELGVAFEIKREEYGT